MCTGQSSTGAFVWGAGQSGRLAEYNFRNGGGSTVVKRWEFVSSLKFAPSHRDALETECDAYINPDGTLTWIRCERNEVASW